MRKEEVEVGATLGLTAASIGYALNAYNYFQDQVFYCASMVLFCLAAVAWMIRGRPVSALASDAMLLAMSVVGAYVLDRALVLFEAAYGVEYHGIAAVVASLLTMFGVSATASGGALLVQAQQGVIEISTASCFTGTRVLCVLVALRYGWSLTLGRTPKLADSVRFSAWLMALLVARFAVLAASVREVPDALASREQGALDLFLGEGLLAIAVGAAALICPLTKAGMSRRLEWRALCLSSALGAVLGIGIFILVWSGDRVKAKAGRVLIDDRLSGVWEPSGRLLGTEQYGDFSTYSFAALTESLSRVFSVATNSDQIYTRDFLADYDVLILKTPKYPLADTEVAAIREWVVRGGGLFAVSDHTDLFGMSRQLNVLLEGSGLQFRKDATSALQNGGFDLWKPSLWGAHPISSGLRPIEFMTACRVAVKWPARPVLLVEDTRAVDADYSKNSNFGNRQSDIGAPQGIGVLCAEGRLGKGRIVAFGDSTILSTFAYHLWGVKDLVERSVLWLNYSVVPTKRVNAVMVGGFALIAICLATAALGTREARFSFLVAIGMSFMGARVLGAQFDRVILLSAPVKGESNSIGFVFEGAHGMILPALGSNREAHVLPDFLSCYLTPIRLGLEPVVCQGSDTAGGKCEALVVVNPEYEVSAMKGVARWWDQFVNYARSGGTVIVFRRREHAGHEHDLTRYLEWETGRRILGEFDDVAHTVETPVGDGRVVVVTGSEEFTTDSLGHPMSFPGRRSRRRYDYLAELWRSAVSVAPVDRRTYVRQ